MGFTERYDLQEWIAKNPVMLGDDELLIIQKEFSGFDETRERLDLLALDKDGNLVIIENKLDDTGADVTWQALKYTSYCSTFTQEEVVQIFQDYLGSDKVAEDEMREFFRPADFSEITLNREQRIILVASNFRKEVTSTVMWLFNRGINIKCIKVTPYQYGEVIFIDTEQIIPVKDAEEYLIKLRQKTQQESIKTEADRQSMTRKRKFWSELLPRIKEKSDLFKNVSPKDQYYLSCGSGHRGISYDIYTSGVQTSIDLWIARGTKEINKQIFDKLYQRKEEIESKFGKELAWGRLDPKIGSSIAYHLPNANISNEADWNIMIDFFVEYMPKFEAAMKDILSEVMKDDFDSNPDITEE